jgi:hypothetical protein
MTLLELQQVFPDASAETWHQHTNGRGWVENTATIEPTVYIGPNAWVYGNAWVYDDARVYGNAWEKSPLQIQGTRHFLNACAYTEIAIGCHQQTIAWWLKHYQAVGRKEGYSPDEIEEYGTYIRLFAQRYSTNSTTPAAIAI